MRRAMNVITWRQGRVGKGWLFPDDTVWAWAVTAREQPHHADVAHPAGSIRFRISVEGYVDSTATSAGSRWCWRRSTAATAGKRRSADAAPRAAGMERQQLP